MLIDRRKYKSSLTDLWNRVFGDSCDFIELIFKPEYDGAVLCFAEIEEDKAVSAFYLIKNTLKYENELFDGYYLYAAATLPEYRKFGIMSKLIREAQGFCRENSIDFISLVPSEESLYGYYSRFGFEKAMYRCENETPVLQISSDNNEQITDADKILSIRNRYEGNIISFHSSSFGYAFECLSYSGFKFCRITNDSYLLCSDEDDFSEFISTEKKLSENVEKLKMKKRLTSPFALKSYKVHKYKPYGMLFPVNEKLKKQWNFTDIYMNIALD